MLAAKLAELSGCSVTNPEIEIAGATDNSKQVEEGFVFAALSGAKTNGEKYIDEAIANGAAAILLPADKKRKDSRIPYFYAENPRKAFALMAAAFNPLQPETIVAVTGTNGKTSTSVFTRQIWEQAGLCAASMGTIGIISPVMTKEGNLTSPPPSILYKDVNELASKGVTNLAIEASSHGIDQCRLDGLKIKAAGFTNLTRDHLDYHGDMEHYLLAKLRLFSDLIVPEGAGVINADIAECNIITSTCKSRKIQTFTYGFQGKELRILNHRADALGQNLLLDVLGKRYNIRLPLTGDFQAMNALCALGLAIACGADADKAVEALESLKGSWGRLENVVTLSNGAAVYVDYAHTPDAMENVLNTLRPNTVGKLSIVFGCGGDRDRGKRPQMGAVAAKLADRVIVTDDNPRTEDANFIRSEIMPACPDALEIGDRRKAIFAAIKELNAGDVLVIAGKGHETGQKIGDTVHPFNDTEEAINAALTIDKNAYEGSGPNTAVIWKSFDLTEITDGATTANWDIYGVAADVKQIKPGDIFIALENEEEDTHELIGKALENGANSVLVHKSKKAFTDTDKVIVVNNSLNALEEMAKYARERSEAKTIAFFENSISEQISKEIKSFLKNKGKVHFINDNRFKPIDINISLANISIDTRFIIINHKGTNFTLLKNAAITSQPDIILLTAEETDSQISDYFAGANVGAALIIEDTNPDLKDITLAARANGISKIIIFGTSENADIKASEYGNNRSRLALAAIQKALEEN